MYQPYMFAEIIPTNHCVDSAAQAISTTPTSTACTTPSRNNGKLSCRFYRGCL